MVGPLTPGRTGIAWTPIWLCLALGAGAADAAETATRSVAEIDAEIAEVKKEIAAELARVRFFLVQYDQLQRLDAALGRIRSGDADARLRGKAQDLYRESYDDVALGRLLEQHRAAVGAFFDRVEQESAAASRWPDDKPPEVYQAMAKGLLTVLRKECGEKLAARADIRPLLEKAAQVRAWTTGKKDLAPEANPFAGQDARIVAAIPSEDLRAMLTSPTQPPAPGVPPATPPSLPTTDPPEFARGLELREKGDLRGALAEFDRALVRDPRHVRTLLARANARLWLNDIAGARADHAAAVAINPTDPYARYALAFIELVAGNLKGAQSGIDELLRDRPGDTAALLVRAQVAMYAGDAETARRLFGQVVAVEPARAQSLYEEAVNAMNYGVPAVAVIQFSSVIWMAPESHGAWYGYGEALARLGAADRAIQAFQEYLKRDSTSVYAQYARQRIQALQGGR